jgi:hypothetical protein
MTFCDARCQCFFAMQHIATEALTRLEDLGDELSRMRWAWDKSDSRSQRVIELSKHTAAFVSDHEHFKAKEKR